MHERRLHTERYRRMIVGAAWRAWRALPIQTRAWIEVEDLVEDAMMAAYHASRKYKWKENAYGVGAMQNRVDQYLIRHYIEKYGADKRGWVFSKEEGKKVSIRMYSIQAMQERLNEEGKPASEIVHQIPDLVVGPGSIIDNLMSECVVVPALGRVYLNASDNLKEKFVEWFWYTKDKYHCKGKPFKEAAREFRHLCIQEDLECEDCVHLVRSPKCLDSLSRKIFGIPYDNGCYPIVN